jgi:hypothetical protein
MSNTIGPKNPNVYAEGRKNVDASTTKTAAELRDAAKDLHDGAGALIDGAAADLVKGAGNAGMSAAHVVAAGGNAIMATANLIVGTADVVEAGGRTAAAGGLAVAGSAGFVVEGLANVGRFVAKNVSEAFAALATALSGPLGDGKTWTVRELKGDVNAVRFSEAMFGKAANQLNKAGDAMNMAWASYATSVVELAMGGLHVGAAVGYAAAVGVNLTTAAGKTALAATGVVGEGLLRASAVGVEVGGAIAKGAITLTEEANRDLRDLAVLTAKLSASVANKLALPDQGKIVVTEGEQDMLKQLNATIGRLQKAGLTKAG